MSANYCCENKCFEIPRSQVDGIACNRCYSFSYCVCYCEIIQKKMEIFIQKILKKAKELQTLTNTMIGVKIYNGAGYVSTHCSYIKKEEEENTEIKNIFYLYHDNLEYIPDISLEPNEYTIIVSKTFESKIYVLDLKK